MSPTPMGARRTAIAVCVASLLSLGGCGGSGSSHPARGAASGARAAPAGRTSTAAEPVKFLPNGVRVLVRGRIPAAASFSITAERYRFQGRTYVDLSAAVGAHGMREGGGSGSFSPQGSHQTFAWSTQEGCQARPHARWAIVYGLLRDAGDTVTARSGQGVYALRTAPMPSSFRAGGELAYAVLPQRPSEVLVRTRGGRVAQDEKLDFLMRAGCTPGESMGLHVMDG
jgi:hypothetical protein